MRSRILAISVLLFATIAFILGSAFSRAQDQNPYTNLYWSRTHEFEKQLEILQQIVREKANSEAIKTQIRQARLALKRCDVWYRYLEPIAYKKLNGPLPVEWETEVFEKYEKPYKRLGAGLTLAELYLDNESFNHDTLLEILKPAENGMRVFKADSITSQLSSPSHFLFAQRLSILNLASIYTTGFECPDTGQILPEIIEVLKSSLENLNAFKQSYCQSQQALGQNIAEQENIVQRIHKQLLSKQISGNLGYANFNHFEFIQQINEWYKINVKAIQIAGLKTQNLGDFSLNNVAENLWDKNIYTGQNHLGIYAGIQDETVLKEIREIGKLLFYDPLLSGNLKRSCASCHHSETFFTDTLSKTALQFDASKTLDRNTPSLVNVTLNHLLMLDGKHTTLQEQAAAVITNPVEMNGKEKEVLQRILSVKKYKVALNKFASMVPLGKKITMLHLTSAITSYAGSFSQGQSIFTNFIANRELPAQSLDIAEGFNLFMGKAQCGTCHFFPFFNGAKPPFIGSEFEVLGTPADSAYQKLSPDAGRYQINPAFETKHAFRTPTLLNIAHTAPYMHNGVFKNLQQVMEFYNHGGGAGHGLAVPNQTLSADSLHLNQNEIQKIIVFMQSLTEPDVNIDARPIALPSSRKKQLNGRKPGGEY